MFEHLAKHNKILVTGPHRSGTTFAATAIAHDLKEHGIIKEELCWLPNLGLNRLEYWLTNPNKVVVQAPFAADACHQYPGVFVVFMHRDIDDIEASQKRMYLDNGGDVFWPSMEMTERGKYHNDDYSQRVSEVKYDSWKHQKERIANYLDLDYESLADHPLWIPKDNRKEFTVRQVSAVA